MNAITHSSTFKLLQCDLALKKPQLALMVGTRAEAIKMAPIIHALRPRSDELDLVILSTASKGSQLSRDLALFEIKPDLELDLTEACQSAFELNARVLSAAGLALNRIKPDALLVQGNKTAAFAAALAAFHLKIPVAHVEAGLRSHSSSKALFQKGNGRLIAQMTDLHLAPTPLACCELLREGIPRNKIVVTGNTVVDTLHSFLNRPFSIDGSPLAGIPFDSKRAVLVTSRHDQTWGQGLLEVCLSLKELVYRHPDVIVVYPLHMNEDTRKMVTDMLAGTERIYLTEPLDYLSFVNLMRRSDIILSDSGGVQEQAPTLGKPLLVLSQFTDRSEAQRIGVSRVIGTSRDAIITETSRLLTNSLAYRSMLSAVNPFGDGFAATRIAEALCRWTRGETPCLETEQQYPPCLQREKTIKYIN